MHDVDAEARTRAPDEPGAARRVASEARDAAGGAATDVAETAKEQAGQVVGEVKSQARGLAAETRDRVQQQARSQNDRLADALRRMADELDEMAGDRGDSPAKKVVSQVASGGRRVADYLAERGPEGVLQEVQEFARRRPGAFLATAAVAGFVVGRLGKGALSAGRETEPEPYTGLRSFRDPSLTTGYAEPASTTYASSTYAGSPGYTTPPEYPPPPGYAGPTTAAPAAAPVLGAPATADPIFAEPVPPGGTTGPVSTPAPTGERPWTGIPEPRVGEPVTAEPDAPTEGRPR